MSEVKEGQVWSFKGRDIDPDPRLIIIEKEEIKGVKVLHISVSGIKVQNSHHETYGGLIYEMGVC